MAIEAIPTLRERVDLQSLEARNPFRHAFTVNLTSSNSTSSVKDTDTKPKLGSVSSPSPKELSTLKPLLSQGAFRVAPKANSSKSRKKILLPIIPHLIEKPFYPSQDTGPPNFSRNQYH